MALANVAAYLLVLGLPIWLAAEEVLRWFAKKKTPCRTALFGIGLGLYLVGFGMLAGVALERMRFDHRRAAILARYDEALREWHTFRIELERVADRHSEH